VFGVVVVTQPGWVGGRIAIGKSVIGPVDLGASFFMSIQQGKQAGSDRGHHRLAGSRDSISSDLGELDERQCFVHVAEVDGLAGHFSECVRSQRPRPGLISAPQSEVEALISGLVVRDVERRERDDAAESAMTAGITAGHGTYDAVCSAVILIAAMTAPPQQPCPGCLATLREQVERSGPVDEREPAVGSRSGWRAWLLHRNQASR